MLASYVLNPETSHSLSELSRKYLGIVAKSYKELVAKGKTIADISIRQVADYCGMDVYTTFQLVNKLTTELDEADKNAPSKKSLHQLLLEVEQPLEPILAEMEYCGIRIDSAYLQELSQQLEKRLAELEENTYEAAGRKFNLGERKMASVSFVWSRKPSTVTVPPRLNAARTRSTI